MWELLKQWFKDYFAEPEVAILLICAVVAVLAVVLLGHIFAPILAGLVIAYLLESLITPLHKRLHLPRWLSVTLVYSLFIGVVLFLVLGLLPLLWKQLLGVASDWPVMIAGLHTYLNTLPTKYPNYISQDLIQDLLGSTDIGIDRLTSIGKIVVTYTVNSLPNLVSWLVYLFLVPLTVLFFLKDKLLLQHWAHRYLPERSGLLQTVGREMKSQLGNYVRGKVIEVIVVGIMTYIGFRIFDLNYAVLLAFCVGLSVIIPYVGMVVVTIPVVIIGLLQYGTGSEFGYMLAVYLVIQALDGNVFVPLLFSEAVNLHPVAIIAAVLFFGSVWGFWGLFFAIPLATLVNAIISAWVNHAVQLKQMKEFD